MMSVEQWVKWLAGESEATGKNLPYCRFVHHKSHMVQSRSRTWAIGD
jgi:hypothetical protein